MSVSRSGSIPKPLTQLNPDPKHWVRHPVRVQYAVRHLGKLDDKHDTFSNSTFLILCIHYLVIHFILEKFKDRKLGKILTGVV